MAAVSARAAGSKNADDAEKFSIQYYSQGFLTDSSVGGPMSEEAGKPPVVVVSEETSVTSGTAVQEKLISAARVFSNLLKPTYGPRGLDKMLYKTNGSTAVTNDGAKIVAEIGRAHV